MKIFQDSKNLLGDASCVYGTEAITGALMRSARALAPGSLTAWSQHGLEADDVYRRYGRSSGSCVHGALHAKVFYREPYIVVGSSNWTIASEANREVSVLLEATNQEALNYFERLVSRLSSGASQVGADYIRSKPMKQDRLGCRAAKNRR